MYKTISLNIDNEVVTGLELYELSSENRDLIYRNGEDRYKLYYSIAYCDHKLYYVSIEEKIHNDGTRTCKPAEVIDLICDCCNIPEADIIFKVN